MNETPGKLHILHVSTEAIPAIRAIAHATWPVAFRDIISPVQIAYMLELMYGEASLHEQVTVKGHRFLLAEEDGTAVGFAGFETRYEGRDRSRLHKLYTLPSIHGKGIGVALLRKVEEEVRKAGDTSIELNVNRFNPAKEFYARQGFRIERDEVLDIGQGFVMDDHVMVKGLR